MLCIPEIINLLMMPGAVTYQNEIKVQFAAGLFVPFTVAKVTQAAWHVIGACLFKGMLHDDSAGVMVVTGGQRNARDINTCRCEFQSGGFFPAAGGQ